MEVQRPVRYRSIGTEHKSPSVKTKRPSLGDRHKSAPLAPRPRQSQSHFSVRNTVVAIHESNQRTNLEIGCRERPELPVNIVVLGGPKVGKTTFVRNAVNSLYNHSNGLLSGHVFLDGQQHNIQICELRLDDIHVANGHSLKWPEAIGNRSFPSIDGIICMYDVTNEDSITDIPRILYALGKSKLPVVLVANKSDATTSEQEVGIAFIDRMSRSFPLVIVDETSGQSEKSAQKCLLTAIKATSVIRKLGEVSAEDCKLENFDIEPQTTRSRTSELQLISDVLAEPLSEQLELNLSTDGTLTDHNRSNMTKPCHRSRVIQAYVQEMNEGYDTQMASHKSNETSTKETPRKTIANVQQIENNDVQQLGTREIGVPFSELVDRLLRLPASKNEAKFVPAFLCLYRAFATPRCLLAAVISRFDLVNQSNLVPLSKAGELLRYLQVMTHWTAYYPGDFVEPATRRKAVLFARELEHTKTFGPAAKEIAGNLLTIIMDDDHDWAHEDPDDSDSIQLTKSAPSAFTLSRIDSSRSAESDNSDDEKAIRRRSARNSGSGSTSSSLVRSSVTSSQSATNLFNLEHAREQSRLFKALPHIPLTKVQWRQFMSIPTDELANEITRIDWIMYSAIRARDFVRHVSLPSQQRAKMKHTDTIGLMVKHFNHLALFVSGMILFRDKAKHRAKILEKFMDLAWKVRQLNNYNSLGAIVAGITGPEIARLWQTHDLIPAETEKQFLRLTVLMSLSRSHSAYRMAWENSFSERIPFIPLIRQDLTMAAQANPTFIGENINWKKFEIMGGVIVSVQESHEKSYSFPEKGPKSLDTIRLLLETKVIEESEECADPRGELFERSLQVEPQVIPEHRKSAAGLGVKRTMAGWF